VRKGVHACDAIDHNLTSPPDERHIRVTAWLSYRLGLLALLIIELVCLVPPFDTSVDLAGSWQGRLLFVLQHGLRPAFVTAAIAIAFFGWPTLRRELRQLVELPGEFKVATMWLMAHVLVVTPLAMGSATKRAGRLSSIAEGEVWLLAWIVLGLAALATLGLAALPMRFWRKWIWLDRVRLLGAACIGGVAYFLGYWSEDLWGVLQRSTFNLVLLLLKFVCRNVLADPAQQLVATRTFAVQIGPACSGIEGIGLVSVFLAVYLFIYRSELRFPQSYLLLPAGVVTIWFLNGIRIAALVLIGDWAPEVAVRGFHSVAGWLFFNLAVCCLVGASWQFKMFRLSPNETRTTSSIFENKKSLR
jgi:exosortase E/protease (VPEID-CTERM system)